MRVGVNREVGSGCGGGGGVFGGGGGGGDGGMGDRGGVETMLVTGMCWVSVSAVVGGGGGG